MKQPLYHQIYCKLRAQIDSGDYLPGDMLPTEQELLDIFKASRAPIRQALGQLENEGLVKRFPGKGTFVTSPPEELLMWFNFSPFRTHFKKDWDGISCRTLTADTRFPPSQVSEFLRTGKNEKVVCLERLRLLDSRPVIFSRHYFPSTLDLEKIKAAGDFFSVRAMLMEFFSIEITRIEDCIRAILPPEEVMRHLDVEAGLPLLLAERRSHSRDTPMQFDCFYTMTDIWDYRIVLEKGPDGTTTAASSG